MSHNLVTAPALGNAYGLSFEATINEKKIMMTIMKSGTYPVELIQ